MIHNELSLEKSRVVIDRSVLLFVRRNQLA
jgi:hypothetical protein